MGKPTCVANGGDRRLTHVAGASAKGLAYELEHGGMDSMILVILSPALIAAGSRRRFLTGTWDGWLIEYRPGRRT